MPKLTIAVDGPAGSGKSTVAQRVARELGYRYIDTGAMYRAMAWLVLHRGIAVDDRGKIVEAVRGAVLEVFPSTAGMGVRVNGEDVTGDIRSEQISAATSAIAVIPEVREQLVRLYRQQGGGGGAVIEGRDIGTVAFPTAELKIYLNASVTTRARRRLEQNSDSPSEASQRDVETSIRERDARDTGRVHAPLSCAADAVEIDTTSLSLEEVCRRVLELAVERGACALEKQSS